MWGSDAGGGSLGGLQARCSWLGLGRVGIQVQQEWGLSGWGGGRG